MLYYVRDDNGPPTKTGDMTTQEVFDSEPRITAAEAQREVKRHGADWSEFTAEYGDRTAYNGADVLG